MPSTYDHKHILFVDDDPTIRIVAEEMLRAELPGVRVTGAADGAQALQVLDREPVDLLITDMAMPGVDGPALQQQVQRRRLGVPTLVVTANDSLAAETRALSGGAIDYFEKPIRAERFIPTVKAALDGVQRRSQLEVVSLAGVMRLVATERRTCTLRVASGELQGVLVFESGALVDARQGELSGTPAAQAILAWEHSTIALDTYVHDRPRTIHARADELARGAPRTPARAEQPANVSDPTKPARFVASAPSPVQAAVPVSTRIAIDRYVKPQQSRQPVVMPAPMTPPAALRPSSAPAAVPVVAARRPASSVSVPARLLRSTDYFELMDRVREYLLAAETEAAELLLQRALELRPGDRIVLQNLQILARKRGRKSASTPERA